MSNVTIDPVQEDKPGVGIAERIVRVIGNDAQGRPVDRTVKPRVKDFVDEDLLAVILYSEPGMRRRMDSYQKTGRTLKPAYVCTGDELFLVEEPDTKTYCRMLTELSNRLSQALACLCFVAVGIPLGMKHHRHESAVGTGLCLAIAAAFYLFIITAESLSKYPYMHPYLISWIPVVICVSVFCVLLHRNP